MRNTLYYGDNLSILRDYIDDESVDLIYLDPPFNSQRTYNVLFRHESGEESEAQIAAFEDTWHWNQATEAAYNELVTQIDGEVGAMIAALRQAVGQNQMMAYLVMMAIRLVELHRVLKPTGSLYLHCDPTASHYLKIILDTIFGVRYYRNEIIWERFGSHNDPNRYGRVTDSIFFYTKSDEFTFNTVYAPYSEDHLEKRFKYTDPDGRRFWPNTCLAPGGRGPRYDWNGHVRNWRFTRENMQKLDDAGYIYYSKTGVPYRKNYLDEMSGQPLQNLWTDIKMTKSGAERLGYPTQKPEALLERIVAASSNPGDIVLDPFCGCGTTIAAAQTLGRKWIGIDITHLSIALQKYRLRDAFDLVAGEDYAVIGEPVSLHSARQLAQDDRYQFQWWALSLIQARPLGQQAGTKTGRKGADKGIDGAIYFIDDSTGKAKRTLVQVKSGKVGSRDIRDLVGTVNRENAEMGIFITLEEPTRPMTEEAAAAGFYNSPGWGQSYPKIQILTIHDLLDGKKAQLPPASITFQQAPKAKQDKPQQPSLGLDT